MQYNGIELEPAKGPVTLSHSNILDLITGQNSTQNMDWTEKLLDLPWGKLKEHFGSIYLAASRLNSILSMDYQVCNGGIAQYFDNRYHEERDACSENDVKRIDISVQQAEFKSLVMFAEKVFPDRTEENQRLASVCEAFRGLWLEEDVPVYETYECEEDEYIIDEDTGEEIPNPEWFEDYEECVGTEEVVRGDEDGTFDNNFYKVNDYLEEVCELRAQLLCKLLNREVARFVAEYEALRADVESVLSPEAQTCSLAEKIAAAEVHQNKQNVSSQKQLDDSPVL